jgi:type IV secretory pathway TrbF-like protein
MKNYKEMYEQLLAEFNQYKEESIKWSVEDFTEYNHPTHKIDRRTAQYVLENMIRVHDAEFGITWIDVEYLIEQHGTPKQL